MRYFPGMAVTWTLRDELSGNRFWRHLRQGTALTATSQLNMIVPTARALDI